MLRSLKDLVHYSVSATDGEVGKVVNFLLDDERWVVRYLVVDTGGMLGGRRVLISPIAFREPDWSTHRFHLALTMAKVEHSPSVDIDQPVSRQHEREHIDYYGYSPYWGYSALWGLGSYPGALVEPDAALAAEPRGAPAGDAHLRSAEELRGYHVQGTDEPVGHIEDFVLDDRSWEVRYLVINTSNWWFGKEVLVAPNWARTISYDDRKVYVDMTRDRIKASPAWDASAAVNREYEARLYDYYGRPAYWAKDRPAVSPRDPARHPRP